MLKELIDVANKLFQLINNISEIDEKRRRTISDFFLKISECLQAIVDQLEKKEEPHLKWETLANYAQDLSKMIGEEIGTKKAEELSNQLKNIAKNPPESSDIVDIKKSAGKFQALADMFLVGIPIDAPPEPISRRKLLTYTILGAGAAGFAGSSLLEKAGAHPLNQLPTISWNMDTFLGDNIKNTILYNAPQQVCDLVRKMTNRIY